MRSWIVAIHSQLQRHLRIAEVKSIISDGQRGRRVEDNLTIDDAPRQFDFLDRPLAP